MQHYFIDIDSPLGKIRLVTTDAGLTGCYFQGQKYFPDTIDGINKPEHPLLSLAAKHLHTYFYSNSFYSNSQKSDPLKEAITLTPKGTDFQQQVWKALLRIPYGSNTTYSELACTIGRPRSTRAVAAAIGRNPISLFVPCHRVIGKNGDLTGYAGGIDRKRHLLALEQQPGKTAHSHSLS